MTRPTRAIALPTYRPGETADKRALWADLRLCLHSIEAYALDYVNEVVVAWEGAWAPDGMPEHPKFRYIERPPGMNMATAWTWAIEQTTSEELIQFGDDTVLHPDTMRLLFEDIDYLRATQPQTRLGVIGGRSNVVAGIQNVREPNGGVMDSARGFTSENQIISTEFVFTVFAWYTRSAWELVGRFPPDLIWGGDMLFSYDLRRLGFTNFISRAYVHHIGWRGSELAGDTAAELDAAGDQWLVRNRPDFMDHLISIGHKDAGVYERAT